MPIVDALEVLTEEGRIKACEKRWGVANDTVIQRFPNGVTPSDANSDVLLMKLPTAREVY